MTDIEDPRRSSNGRQMASHLRELLNKVDIKAGADRSDEREVSTMIESEAERSQSPQSSIREVFAKARTGVPRPGLGNTIASSRLRRESFDSDVSSAPTAMFTPARPREANPGTRPPSHLRMDHLGGGDDDLTQERTPIARAPPQPLPQNTSSAASLNALRARLENASETNTDTGDLTGWDRSARSLLTTRGQASTSKFNMYLDDDQETNLLDEDLGGVPALTVSHVDDSNMRFLPSVANTSRTPVTARRRPAIPKGPSLQSASIAERLAGIPDDGLDFDDTDREDFNRNRMDDDSDDLLHNENDLLRSASPPPDDLESPQRPNVYRSLGANGSRSARPISGSWENVGEMEESLLSLPVPPEEAGDRPASQTPKPQTTALPSGSGSGSRLMQTIQAEEDSFEKSQHDQSRQSSEDKSKQNSTVSQSDTNASGRSGKSRLSMFGRSRLPLAKPAQKAAPETSHNDSKASTNPVTSEISFPRPVTPTSPSKNAPSVSHTPQSPPKSHPTGSMSPTRAGSPTRSGNKLAPAVSPPRPSSRLSMSGSPGRPGVPATPSRIPRVSMHGSHPSWDRMEDLRGTLPDTSPSRMANTRPRADSQTPARSQSSLGQASRLTPARSVSSLDHRGRETPPRETDVDRERAWGKPLPKLTHANLRMRHDSMESSVGSLGSVVGALSPGRPGSVIGGARPTTPSNRSFVGYSVRHGSEVSSSQGSAGSDEDAELRRSKPSVLSPPSKAGTRSGKELRPHSSAASHRSRTTSLTSPTAASLARSGGLVRHTSLKTPSKTSTAGAPPMRHSMSASSFVGSSAASDRASPLASPRAPGRYSVDYGKDLEHLRERDWGRPANSRAPGLGSGVRPRVVSTGSPGGARARVVSGGSVGERPESPIPRVRGPVRPRPHTIHFGGSAKMEEGRTPLDGGEELLEEQEEFENGRGPLGGGIQEMVEGEGDYFRVQEESIMEERQHTRESVPSPPSPSRSIPLPPSPPQVHAAPTEASVSLFRDQSEDMSHSPVAESTRRMVPAQQESPTISFMDTLPPLPGPPSDEEDEPPMIIAPVQPVRPLVNTRLSAPTQRYTRDSSPTSGAGSGSASERTPRANSLVLQVPSPAGSRTPTPPTVQVTEPKAEPTPAVDLGARVEEPKSIRTRSRSNTLGSRVESSTSTVRKDSIPRVEINTTVTRAEIDSAATPLASQWMERNRLREEKKLASERGESSASVADRLTPRSETPGNRMQSPLQQQSDLQVPMVSQKGKEIIQRMQQEAAALARDLDAESSQPVPRADVAQAETEQIVRLSTAARTERERLERLRSARPVVKEKEIGVVSPRRRSVFWILSSMFLAALCAWLALYALSQHATNVYLDPLYPILYGGDVNPLRSARTIDTFPSSWNAYMVPKDGITQWLPVNTISQNWQKLWGIPNLTMQHLLLNWPPS